MLSTSCSPALGKISRFYNTSVVAHYSSATEVRSARSSRAVHASEGSRAPRTRPTRTTRTPLAQRARRVRDSHRGAPSRSQSPCAARQRVALPLPPLRPPGPCGRGRCRAALRSAWTCTLVNSGCRAAAAAHLSAHAAHTQQIVREGSRGARAVHGCTFLSGLSRTKDEWSPSQQRSSPSLPPPVH